VKASIIVPTYKRPAQLRKCLEALSGQDFDRSEFEVIVSFDGGGQIPGDLHEEFRNRLQLRTVGSDTNGGPGAARNLGIAASSGELIALIDDDCTAHPKWLSTLWRWHQQLPDAVVGGRVANVAPSIAAEASQLISDLVYDFYNADPTHCAFFATNNCGIPRRQFEAVGLFDEEFKCAAEDRELSARFRAAGTQMVLMPDVLVDHAHLMGLRGFLRQHFNYGTGASVYHRVRKHRGEPGVTGEMGFHGQLPRAAWRRLKSRPLAQALQLSMYLCLWQVANAVGYFYENFRYKFAAPPGGAGVRSAERPRSEEDPAICAK